MYVIRQIETADIDEAISELTSDDKDESDNDEDNTFEEETIRLVKKEAETPYLNVGFIQDEKSKMDFNCVVDTGSSKAVMAEIFL